jgi:hypothetical protein
VLTTDAAFEFVSTTDRCYKEAIEPFQSRFLLFARMRLCPKCKHRIRRLRTVRCRVCGTFVRPWLLGVYALLVVSLIALVYVVIGWLTS